MKMNRDWEHEGSGGSSSKKRRKRRKRRVKSRRIHWLRATFSQSHGNLQLHALFVKRIAPKSEIISKSSIGK